MAALILCSHLVSGQSDGSKVGNWARRLSLHVIHLFIVIGLRPGLGLARLRRHCLRWEPLLDETSTLKFRHRPQERRLGQKPFPEGPPP